MIKVRIFLFLFLIIGTNFFSQLINTNFVAPDTVCVNQTFSIQNTSTGSINTSYWSFCSSATATVSQAVNLGSNSTLFSPTFLSINNDGGNYFMFVSNNNPGSLARLAFGNNLNNIPISTNLGNFANTIPINGEGLVIEKEGLNWCGIFVGGPQGSDRICRLNFGTSLANTPTVVNMGNIGAMFYPIRLQIIHSGGNKYGFVTNYFNNTITRFDFGNSLSNTPTGINLGNIGSMNGPGDFAFISYGGNWYAFVTNDINNTITRLDFGNSLLNVPIGTNLGNPGGLSNPRGIYLDVDCNGIKGQITNRTPNGMLNLSFPSGPTGPITTTNLGNIASFSFPHSIEKYRVGDTVFSFIPNAWSNSISRLKYASCVNSSVPSSTVQNLSPIAFNVPGTYQISLHNNEVQFNKSVYCKNIVVYSPTLTATSTPTSICSGFNASLSATGAASYTWNPGAVVGNSIVVTPAASTIYTVSGISTSTLGCIGSQTIGVSVTPTPTLITLATSTNLCAGNSATLSSSGAASFTWNPGAIVSNSIIITPTVSTVYTVTGTNGNCAVTKTIQVDVNPNPTVTANSSSVFICTGMSVTLISTGANSYTWNPGNFIGGTVVAMPITTTNFTVTGENTFGCKSTAVIIVTVITTPTLSITQSSTTICDGNSATLTVSGASNYTWNPGPLITSSIVVSPTATTVYTVLGTIGTCSDMNTATVNVVSNPTINVTVFSNVVCYGGSETLFAGGANTYSWSPPTYLSGTTGQTVLTTPAVPICYTVVGYNSFGCASGSETICMSIVNTTQTFTSIATPSLLCAGSTGTISSSGASSYTYFTSPALFTPSISVNPTVSMVYTIQARFSDECLTTNTILINVQQKPAVTITSPSVICKGDQIILEGSGATTYTWNPGSSTNTNVSVTPTGSITYTLFGQTGVCTGSVVKSITVNPVPSVSLTVLTPTICQGNVVGMSASGANSYTWQPGNIINSAVSMAPLTTTIYTVTGSSLNCLNSNTAMITVVNNPTISITKTSTVVCHEPGDTFTVTASGADIYTWLPVGSNAQSIAITPSINMIYVLVGSNIFNCSDLDTVFVNLIPSLVYSVNQTTICSGTSVTLTASGALGYTWFPGNQTTNKLIVSPEETTTYTITGTSGLCSKTNTFSIEVVQNPVYDIPEVLTPNDDGKNDLFKIVTRYQTKIKLSVFNRWGNLVYQNPEYDNSWNGYSDAGLQIGHNKLPQGTYYYIIELDNCNHEVVKGYVVIQY